MNAFNGSSTSPAGGDSPFPHVAGDLVPWPYVQQLISRILARGDDLFPWPWLKDAPFSTGGSNQCGPRSRESLGRAKYRATRLGTSVVITAEGMLGYWNELTDIRQLPQRIFPPQFGFFVCTPEIGLPATRPFTYSETVGYPLDAKTLVMHDADGAHTIEITEIKSPALSALMATPASLAGTTASATGTGRSLQEAFDNAVAHLPAIPKHPDQLFVYTLAESGKIQGGIAGVNHYFAKVTMTS